jgi:RNA polymerase sigma factor (sigma-70 family)
MSSMSQSESRRDPFASTRWSLVAAAGHGPSPRAQTALAELCQSYWKPVYGYVRRRTADEHLARDLTQGFFARLLEKDFFYKADPSRGRFRAFLLTALKHFLIDEADKERRRLPRNAKVLSFDFAVADSRLSWEPATEETPERLFDRQWALNLLDNVLIRLRDELIGEGKEIFFETCKGFLSGEDQRPLAEVAPLVGMTAGALKVALHRLRKRYRALLRAEVAQTVASADDVDAELRDLLAVLSG